MNYYSFSSVTKEYTGVGEAKLSPLEKNVYLLPGRATFIEPPQAGENEVAIWNGQAWEIKQDFRGETVYDTATGEPFAICDIGPLRGGVTPTVPPRLKQYYSHDGVAWIPNESKRAALLEMAKNKIDAATDTRILTGFQFSGHNFKLSLENQMNFKTESEMRDYLVYPHRVKAIDGYFAFESAEQYRLFYLAGIAFIRQAVEAGWAQKDALNNLSTADLIAAINEV
ncbi:MAG: hypothetical protein WCI51_00885 [Lentisphaerota bacterium]